MVALHHDYHSVAMNSESVVTRYGCQCGGLGSPTCPKVTSTQELFMMMIKFSGAFVFMMLMMTILYPCFDVDQHWVMSQTHALSHINRMPATWMKE